MEVDHRSNKFWELDWVAHERWFVDFNQVEEHNIASQAYFEKDLGKPKVEATGTLLAKINQRIEVAMTNERFRRSMDTGDILFCAVDSIENRRLTKF